MSSWKKLWERLGSRERLGMFALLVLAIAFFVLAPVLCCTSKQKQENQAQASQAILEEDRTQLDWKSLRVEVCKADYWR